MSKVVLDLKTLTYDFLHVETVQDIDKIRNNVAIIQNTIREI